MKTVIILAERLTESSLSAVVPAKGVASVRLARNLSDSRKELVTESYRSFRNPLRFTPAVRIELLVEDDAVAAVFDAVSFAYGAGFVSDAEMWIESPALALSA
jgi:nitrogen regulatory protein PII